MNVSNPEKPNLATRLINGEVAALARAISVVERDTPNAINVLRAIRPHLGHAVVVGFTGPPGAGKSTLVNAVVAELRTRDKTVGVVAVDPSSPITGGAVLGDRIRMAEHTMDAGVFIRSLASRGALGGLSAAAAQVADLMDAAGRDVVILETVGAGQSEVEMARIADVRIVIAAPGLGDDIQAIKAGILEIADILVVNKADQPLASQTKRQLEAMLSLRAPAEHPVPVLSTDAIARTGITDLADSIETVAARNERRDDRSALAGRSRHLLAQAVAKAAESYVLESRSQAVEAIILSVQEAQIGLSDAAKQVLNTIHKELDD
ncbi:MAG: methylmalonyl Co-A mutase-associated GTPase MeaB [Rhodobacteraceae bacterium]|nr:MAG: methylmalonyl Co-A mutase-associated GTPase MeaB [Paracoccaceae bacterium]